MSVEQFLHNRRRPTSPVIIAACVLSMVSSALALVLSIQTRRISESRDLALHQRINFLTLYLAQSTDQVRHDILMESMTSDFPGMTPSLVK